MRPIQACQLYGSFRSSTEFCQIWPLLRKLRIKLIYYGTDSQGSCGLLEFQELLENSWNFDFLRNLLEFSWNLFHLLETSLNFLWSPWKLLEFSTIWSPWNLFLKNFVYPYLVFSHCRPTYRTSRHVIITACIRYSAACFRYRCVNGKIDCVISTVKFRA